MPRIFISLILFTTLIACTEKQPQAVGDPRDTVWGDQVKALDKARGVEKNLQEAAERARAAETQQTQ